MQTSTLFSKRRRWIWTLLLILLATVSMVGPTQAISGVVTASVAVMETFNAVLQNDTASKNTQPAAEFAAVSALDPGAMVEALQLVEPEAASFDDALVGTAGTIDPSAAAANASSAPSRFRLSSDDSGGYSFGGVSGGGLGAAGVPFQAASFSSSESAFADSNDALLKTLSLDDGAGGGGASQSMSNAPSSESAGGGVEPSGNSPSGDSASGGGAPPAGGSDGGTPFDVNSPEVIESLRPSLGGLGGDGTNPLQNAAPVTEAALDQDIGVLVPEPASIALMSLGALALVRRRRR